MTKTGTATDTLLEVELEAQLYKSCEKSFEKNDKIRKFCDGLEEEYREEFEEELLNFYRYFCDKLDTMYLGYKSGRFYEKFVNF